MSSLNFHNLSFSKLLVCIKIVEVGCCSVVLLWRLVKTAAQSFKSLFFLRFLVCFFQCADKNMSEGAGWQKIENTSLTHPQLSSAFRFQSLSSLLEEIATSQCSPLIFFFLFCLVDPSNCNTNCSELLEFPMFWSAYLFPSICAILHTGTGHCC